MNADELAQATGEAASAELHEALSRIQHCLAQLSEEQIWQREAESMNAIGNLLLHLAGNLQQWIVGGLGGAPDRRLRAAEFAQRERIAGHQLMEQLTAVVQAAGQVLLQVTPLELLRVRRVQGFDVSGLAIVFHAIPHFRGHTQEIIHQTRAILGDAYQFAWQPASPEQGA